MCSASCWDMALRRDLLNLSHEEFSPPRNKFLYRADHWPLNDLICDAQPGDVARLLGDELDVEGILNLSEPFLHCILLIKLRTRVGGNTPVPGVS